VDKLLDFMALQLTITDEQLQQAFNTHITKLLEAGNYDNPVKRILDNLLGYNGSLTKEFGEQVVVLMRSLMQTPWFATAIGTAMAAELAKRELDKLKR
jgi:hypothetical protein